MNKINPNNLNFLNDDVNTVAKALLGCELERIIKGKIIKVRIVETESYDQDDLASHAFGGKTKRNSVMYGDFGHLYVYFTYGMHYCCNIVTGSAGYGSGVLIRAVEPLIGESIMDANRKGIGGLNVSNGPAKLCQALDIDMQMSGHDLTTNPFRLIPKLHLPESEIITTTRIGISKAKDSLRRFYIKGNAYVSKPW
ncbi:MAG TPA: DNA-3-methyladenine glycosylase [Candidatus Saccharibacteria bacterium]|nr:DNA-3-methyladenine glycosylase [Candidatus Saccharibacteria bacterium]HRQ97752.1 DNA-3-methyladenine glycosylase [Candidatus Saccharibacteria bacterium]